MILADKILTLRKENNWSQEELAEKLNVSRQSVSKWESAASIPDINKILDMARLFGVTTDYLLKDEQEELAYADDDGEGPRRVSLTEANDYIRLTDQWRHKLALGVGLCIFSPVTLIMLGGLSETPGYGISEDLAGGIGVVVLLMLVAVAVAIFISGSMKLKRFEYLQTGDFELEYGVAGIVREKQAAFEPVYRRYIVAGVVICILAAAPLIIAGAMDAPELTLISLTCLLLCLAAVAVWMFIWVSTMNLCFDCLLGQGEYDRVEQQRNKRNNKFGGVFWPIATAIYLGWSFLSMDWHITWLVWPLAGLLYAAIASALYKDE